MANNELEAVAFGKTKEVLAPSGRLFVIREQNGNDDDILSNPVTQKDLSNIDYFILNIVLYELVDNEKVKLHLNDCLDLLIKDRIAIILESRIFTLGSLLKFNYNWGDAKDKNTVAYVEDLKRYIWDYTKDFPTEGMTGYDEYRIPPYQAGAYNKFMFTLSTGKVMRLNLMNRRGEKFLLGLAEEAVTKNAELLARNLEIEVSGGNFTKVENFGTFTKKEMTEIHAAVKELDPTYNAFTDIKNPKTGEVLLYPIMAYSDFFFPTEV